MRQRLDENVLDDAALDDGALAASPLRPEPTHPVGERVREWIDWFGVTRLVTSAVAVVVVSAGAWLLVRTSSPPSEASLPIAQATHDAQPGPTLSVVSSVPEPAATVGDTSVIVHVAGAVLLPGVYELAPASRVDDAIRRAGGPTDGAELGRINMAAPLLDGDQIYVPEIGEALPPPPVNGSSSEAEQAPVGPVDVNRASSSDLETLPGVGPATAAAIVAERDLNGPFASFEDLERVPGIGPAKLHALAGLVVT